MADDGIDQTQHEALQRFADTRRRESEESEIIEPASKHLERAAIYITVLVLLVGLALVGIGKLDVIVAARGSVEPRSELVPVQSRNTGVISAVLVSVGDTVKKGELMMRLGAASAEADLATLERQLALAQDDLKRKQAEAAVLDKAAPDFTALDRNDVDLSRFGSSVDLVNAVRVADLDVKRASHLAGDDLDRIRKQTEARIAALSDTIKIRQQNLAVAGNELTTLEESRALRQQQLVGIRALLAKGISTKTRELDVRDQALTAETAVNSQRAKIGDLSLAIANDRLQVEEQTKLVAEHIVALSEKTQAIGDIIASVNDIAERSQLLALNAAIEAATAGEEGRSFAVVAEEMKTLADQAKQATTQVSSILGEIQKGINSSVMSTEESVKRVANGREQTENTLKSITELAETIEASVRAFEQIVASTNQQRVGLEQVSEALQQIRGGSEQTAAGTRQIEQAVANINALGSQLGHTMERYAV